jgi:hypothetical protein
MARKFLLGSGILIGVYLIVANATGFGRAVGAASGAANSYAKTLQGRG